MNESNSPFELDEDHVHDILTSIDDGVLHFARGFGKTIALLYSGIDYCLKPKPQGVNYVYYGDVDYYMRTAYFICCELGISCEIVSPYKAKIGNNNYIYFRKYNTISVHDDRRGTKENVLKILDIPSTVSPNYKGRLIEEFKNEIESPIDFSIGLSIFSN